MRTPVRLPDGDPDPCAGWCSEGLRSVQ